MNASNMPKASSKFVCQQCGAESPKWMGRCPACGEWNSLVETALVEEKRGRKRGRREFSPAPLAKGKVKEARLSTGIDELDRVLGGGLVSGMAVLVAGEPGMGKSTLMMQVAAKIGLGSLYVSGEESLEQLQIRAERLKSRSDKVLFASETDVDTIVSHLGQKDYKVAIIDSIQTMSTADLSGSAGSVGQVREAAARLLEEAKRQGTALFLVGHVTKEGAIAGPKVLEHLVDTVIYLEGQRFGAYRLLRASKNRFGATDEVGVFEMSHKGLIVVASPSAAFLPKREKGVPGSVVVATNEGTRPILVEIQALVVPTQLAVPRRVATGIDYNRLQLMAAVLTKHLGLPLAERDVYVNVAGGIRVEEPAADLGVCLAIVSSAKGTSVAGKTAVVGEVGLLGEVRPVANLEQRKKEAKRLGFSRMIAPDNVSTVAQAAKKALIA